MINEGYQQVAEYKNTTDQNIYIYTYDYILIQRCFILFSTIIDE